MNACKGFFGWVTIILMLVKLLLHLFSSTVYELHRDELLYFNMGAHPAFGYLSVPPLTAWLAMIVKVVFGNAAFGLRLIPALFGTASVWIMSLIVCRLGGGWRAMLLSGTGLILAPGFLLFHGLFTPNAAEQFFWLLLSWQFIRLISDENPQRWILIGLLCGLAFLNKYSVAIFVVCYVAGILISRFRYLFCSRYLVYAIALGLLMIIPNIYWQYQHNWPVAFHMEALQQTQLSIRHYGDFFSEIFSLLFLSSLLSACGLAYLFFDGNAMLFRWLGLSVLLVMLFFLFSHGKGYYILGVVPVLYAAGGVGLEKWLVRKYPGVFMPATVAFMVCSLAALPYGLPILSFARLQAYTKYHHGRVPYPFATWEDGQTHAVSQVYADMTGWKELTGLVQIAYRKLPEAERKMTTVYCQRNYGYAGAVYFYGRSLGLPEPITFLESYVLWAPDSIPEGPVIYIHRELGGIQSLFRRVEEVGMVSDPWFRETGVKVFLCRDPLPGMQEAYAKEASSEKAQFTRKQ
jgi:hypothetical protein